MKTWLALIFLLPGVCFAAPLPFPTFKVQEIDKTLKVGYGLRIVDLNKDGKLDIVVADSARVIWFDQAQDWKLRPIIDNAAAGVKADNVCLAVRDIDGDGKQDIVLGADWQPNNTRTGGSLQWLRQGKTPDEWGVHKIAESIPTLHRVHFLDRLGTLVVVPLKGERSTLEKAWEDAPVKLLAYDIPSDPTGKWESKVLNDRLHVMHNVRPLGSEIFTASAEGVGMTTPQWRLLGAGNQDNPKVGRGSGEVAVGVESEKIMVRYLAAIEPMHGHQVVVYGVPDRTRTVIDDQLKAGHALWCADLDGDHLDEVVAGFREPTDKGVGPGINIYKAASADEPMVWQKHILDDKGIACEDLACADLNGDGKIDIVACGRATGNVRIYWNEGTVKD